MIGNRVKCFLASIITLIFSFPSVAIPQSFPLDKNHTNITFAVSYFWFSTVTGYFGDFSGTCTIDDENIENSAVNLTIQTESVDTRHDETNKHLRSDEFFNVQKFHTMTFSSTGVEKTGDYTAKMTGDLTLLGVTKPITLDITMHKETSSQSTESTLARFSAHGVLKRSEFGMDYMMWAVGDKIELNIDAQVPIITPINN